MTFTQLINIETVKNMLRVSEDSAAILPKLSCLNERNLKLLPFKPKKYREIGIVTRSGYQNKELVSKVAKIVVESAL